MLQIFGDTGPMRSINNAGGKEEEERSTENDR